MQAIGAETIVDFGGFAPSLRLAEGLELPTYFIVISAASTVALLWTVRRAERLGLNAKLAIDLMLGMMVFGFLGGRALHVIWEQPQLYARNPIQALHFWHGGFVFFGGAFAAFAAGAWIARRRRERVLAWADFFAPVGALVYGLGRIACWMAGCCFGRVCRLNGDGDDHGLAFRFPTQPLAVVYELGVLGALLVVESRRARWTKRIGVRGALASDGGLFFMWLALHSVGRIAMETLRDDDRGVQPFGVSISTWIAAGLLAGSLAWFSRRALRFSR